MLEDKVEKYLKTQIKKSGGLSLKFTSPSVRGVPDQIVLYCGQVYFVELKAPGKKPRASQIALHEEFKEHGVNVHTIDTLNGVDQFITNILKTTPQEKTTDEVYEIKKDMFHLD